MSVFNCRVVCALALSVFGCSTADSETADQAAERFVAAFNRGDDDAMFEMLVASKRARWEEMNRTLPGGASAGFTPRQRYSSVVEAFWGDYRGKMRVVRVDSKGATAMALVEFDGLHKELNLSVEGGAWKVSYEAP